MISLGGIMGDSVKLGNRDIKLGQVVSNPFATAFIREAEGEDHEVSMGQNQLDTIIKMATELKSKMGEDEKEIPAWIQDHIAKAESYISQATNNYHEYGTNENVNERINADIVNRNINLLDKAADMAIKNPKGNVVELAKIIKKYVNGIRNSIKEATENVNEATYTNYDLGNKQYTDKNMTPVQILDLAMAYSQTSGNKMYGNKMPKMIKVANDLAKLNGTTQLDAKSRGKQPALILVLLKNKLVTKDEYIKLYRDLLERQISVVKALKNSDPASRMVGGAAARQAHKDMKGEFDDE